jgi:hypothetical protein
MHLIPTIVPGLISATEVVAGSDDSCAVLADETYRCWRSGSGGTSGVERSTGAIGLFVSPEFVPGTSLAMKPMHACIVGSSASSSTCGLKLWRHSQQWVNEAMKNQILSQDNFAAGMWGRVGR